MRTGRVGSRIRIQPNMESAAFVCSCICIQLHLCLAALCSVAFVLSCVLYAVELGCVRVAQPAEDSVACVLICMPPAFGTPLRRFPV